MEWHTHGHPHCCLKLPPPTNQWLSTKWLAAVPHLDSPAEWQLSTIPRAKPHRRFKAVNGGTPFVCRELINPTVYRRGVLQSGNVLQRESDLFARPANKTKNSMFLEISNFLQGHLNDPMVIPWKHLPRGFHALTFIPASACANGESSPKRGPTTSTTDHNSELDKKPQKAS